MLFFSTYAFVAVLFFIGICFYNKHVLESYVTNDDLIVDMIVSMVWPFTSVFLLLMFIFSFINKTLFTNLKNWINVK